MPVFNCLNCQNLYKEQDSEPYYCSTCLLEKKRIAAEIDKKRSLNPPIPTKSDLQVYDSLVKANGGKFPNYKNLIH